MMLRRFLLAVGVVALALGVVLLVVSLRAPPAPPVGQVPVPEPARNVLVAARTIPAGSLLRPDDMRWQRISVDSVLAGSFAQTGDFSEASLIGAATRRELQQGEQLVADQVVRPNEPGFLPAALKPGRRAVTIPVNPAEVNAGLVTPGDRVDIILTQSFGETGLGISRRSAAETVLRNLRVIAVDQTLHSQAPKAEERRFIAAPSGSGVPKTVTLEVTVQEAQELMLSEQLGKLQLSLRGFGETGSAGLPPPPTWASEVSSALASLDRLTPPPPAVTPAAATTGAAPAPAAYSGPSSIEVIRGTKVELRCFDALGRLTANCPTGAFIPASTAPAAPPPSSGTHAASPAS